MKVGEAVPYAPGPDQSLLRRRIGYRSRTAKRLQASTANRLNDDLLNSVILGNIPGA